MRFEHEAGAGTIVMIGERRWDMPCDTDDPKEIRLLSKHPGVRVVKMNPRHVHNLPDSGPSHEMALPEKPKDEAKDTKKREV